ncbi:MAG: HD domain-containing protein [Candidatus Nitrospinota bacterium M3_3B_026]
MNTVFLWYLGAAFLIFAPLALLAAPGSGKRRLALERIAGLWSKRKEAALRMEEIARLWRDNVESRDEEKKEPVRFGNRRIRDFYAEHVEGRPYFAGPAGEVILELLRLLDSGGACPSVAGGEAEEEGKLDRNTFDALAGVTLADHSMNVAEEMIALVGTGPAAKARAVMTALGHDLGKLPGSRASGYSLGDHTVFSLAMLEGIEGFSGLSYARDVLSAIRDHHGKPREEFPRALREADQRARRRELAAIVAPADKPSVQEAERASAPPVPPAGPAMAPGPRARPERREKPSWAPEDVSLPWFSPAVFIERIKPRINKMEGGRWSAFSMPDGCVYIQPKTVWAVVKDMNPEDPVIRLAAADEEGRRSVIYSVVNRMRAHGAVAEDLVKESYFGGQFVVTMDDGYEMKGFYTPFRAEAFAKTVSELEDAKEGKIRRIKEVSPKYD